MTNESAMPIESKTSARPRLTSPSKRSAKFPWNVSWPSKKNEIWPETLSTATVTVVQILPGEPAFVEGGAGKSDWKNAPLLLLPLPR